MLVDGGFVLASTLYLGFVALKGDFDLGWLRRDHEDLADAHYYSTPEGEGALIIAAKTGTSVPARPR